MGLEKNKPITTTMGAIIASVICASSGAAWGQIACHYDITHTIQAPVCPLTGSSPPTIASAISPDGHYVAGFYYQCGSGNFRAFLYDTNTSQFTTLPLPNGYFESSASDVNDAGDVVGYMTDNGTGPKAFVYHNGAYTILPPPDGRAWSFASGINASGTVCGYRSLADGGDPIHPWQAFIWSPKDGFTDLGVMNGPSSTAYDISNENAVIGYTGGTSSTASNNARAFVYENGIMTILPPVPNGVNSVAWDISQTGAITVTGKLRASSEIRAFTYSDRIWTELIPLRGFDYSFAGRINPVGLLGGVSRNVLPNGIVDHPTLWISSEPVDLVPLTTLPPETDLTAVSALDDYGHIVVAAKSDLATLAFVLSPGSLRPGDVNCDGIVNVADLLQVINQWGKCVACNADLNADGNVNMSDLMVVLDHWG